MYRTLIFAIVFLFTAVAVPAQSTGPDAGPKLIEAPKFEISEQDRADGIGGEMKLAVEIDEKGGVDNASVYVAPRWPCSADLDGRVRKIMKAVEGSVRQYRFAPATRNGKPVSSRVGMTIDLDPHVPKAPAAPDDGDLRTINGGQVNGKAKMLAKPAYPDAARAANAQGAVTVQVLIDENGKVAAAQTLEGHPLLHFAVRDAACRSNFVPTQLDGKPVKVSGTLVYKFLQL